MFEKIGHLVVRRRKAVLALFIIALVAFGALAGLAIPRLSSGGYTDPNSDSAKATSYLTKTFHVTDPAVILEAVSYTHLTLPTKRIV